MAEAKREQPAGLGSVRGVCGTGGLDKTCGPSRKGFHASESWTRAQVRQHPDATLREHAAFCGVDRGVVGKVLKRMRITRKKRPSSIFKYKERDLEKRLAYWRTLRQILAERGSADGVSIDESGFEPVP